LKKIIISFIVGIILLGNLSIADDENINKYNILLDDFLDIISEKTKQNKK